MNEADIQAELSGASMVKLEIHDQRGVTYSVELRGGGIAKLKRAIEHCRCDDEPVAVGQPALRALQHALNALKGLRALIIGETGGSTYECCDGEYADAVIREVEALLSSEPQSKKEETKT